MTVAIAWREKGKTYLGADRRISCAEFVFQSSTSKIFRNGPHTFAFAGTAQAAQCLEFATLPKPPDPSDLRPWLQRALLPEMRRALNAIDAELDSELIYVAPRCAPISIEGWQVNEASPISIGSGGHYALAAFRALKGLRLGAEQRLRRCLDAATQDPACGDGFDVVVLP